MIARNTRVRHNQEDARARLSTMVLAAPFALFAFAVPAAQGDRDCWQCASWDDAQATHEANPWMNLDHWDGIARECRYDGYRCWTSADCPAPLSARSIQLKR
jgi:hypothetical protein